MRAVLRERERMVREDDGVVREHAPPASGT
jgi:hypothetical protein